MIVFVHINKAAGTTLRYVLRSTFGSRHCDVEPWHAAWSDPPFSAEDLIRVRKLYPKLASIAGHRISAHVDLGAPGDALTYVTFLRDPVATTASRFQFQIDFRGKPDLDFEDWIQRDWVRNAQTQRIAGVPDAAEAIRVLEEKNIFVGLAGRFDESMVMFKQLRASSLDISHRRLNVARSNTLAEDLLSNPRTHQLLVEANDQDSELYRYAADHLYPAQQREFGSSLDEAVAAHCSRPNKRFNWPNVVRYQMKQRGLYKPLVALRRRDRTSSIVERVLR